MDTENLIRLIQAVSDSALTGFRYEEGGVRVHLTKKKEQVTGNAVEFLMPEEPSKRSDRRNRADENGLGKGRAGAAGGISHSLVSFMPLRRRRRRRIVQVGDRVKKGQTLGIVEAMKLMNNIESEYDGTVTEILVKNGQNVEYNQPLFRIGSRGSMRHLNIREIQEIASAPPSVFTARLY